MNLQAIKAACMATKRFYIYTMPGDAQWLSNGIGVWPIDGIYLHEDNIAAVFDLSIKQQDKVHIREIDNPDPRCVQESWPGEELCETSDVCLWHAGGLLRPIFFQEGILLIDMACLKPAGKKTEYMEFFLRRLEGHRPIIAGKGSMLVDVIIAPVSVDTTESIIESAGQVCALPIVQMQETEDGAPHDEQVEMREEPDHGD